MLQNFVISIPTAQARRRHISELFAARGIAFQFFDAVTPETGLDEALRRHLPALAQAERLSAGEKACFISHILLWQHCIDHQLPHIGIFEDDILMANDAAEFLNDDQWLSQRFAPEHSFILRVETSLEPALYQPCPLLAPHHNRHFLTAIGQQYNTAGYIISQNAARLLLARLALLTPDQFHAIDCLMFGAHFLFDPQLMQLQLAPALCVQEPKYTGDANATLPSQLGQARHRQNQINKRLRRGQGFTAQLRHLLGKSGRSWEKYKQNIAQEHIRSLKGWQTVPFSENAPQEQA